MNGLLLSGFGFMLIIAPAIMALFDGVEDDADAARWLINQPLQTILAIRAMIISGSGFLIAGAALYSLPS